MSTTILTDGLCFAEGPRWHDGQLWLSDMHGRAVLRVDANGNQETILTLPDDEPSGLGWRPDGTLLVVAMQSRRVLQFDGETVSEVADLSNLASYNCNDMVVDSRGRAYVGNFGFDLHGGGEMTAAELIMVDTDGSARVVADEMMFPNGAVITPDNKTLIVGETMAARLTAFDIAADGSLSNRRLWAQIADGALPDGICLDAEGAIWIASPTTNDCLRIAEGGEVLNRIEVDQGAFACMLGGADGKTLHILTSRSSQPDECIEQRSARVETVRVDSARAGLP